MLRRLSILTASLLILVSFNGGHLGAQAQTLAQARPEEIGFSSAALARLTEIIRKDVAGGVIPGAVVVIARNGKIGYFEAIGQQDPQTKAAMAKDSIFRLYSMTKPLVSVAAMMLVEEGRLKLEDPVAKFIPSFGKLQVGTEKPGADGKPTLELAPARRPITVQDLLRHSSGITYGFFGAGLVKQAYTDAKLFDGDFDNAEFAERIAKLPLAYQPGTIWDYSHSTDILGRVLEVIEGKPLLAVLKTRLLDPLGMKDTSFYVTDKAKQPRIAEPFANDRSLGGGIDFFDPRQAAKWESGGGGLVGTAMDYARFLQMLLNGGSLDGKRYLGPKTVAYMAADHNIDQVKPGPYYLPGPGYGFGLGFAVRLSAGGSAQEGAVGDYYWGGAGGTYFWVDPANNMFVILMLQSPKQRVPYRSIIRNMVYGAMNK